MDGTAVSETGDGTTTDRVSRLGVLELGTSARATSAQGMSARGMSALGDGTDEAAKVLSRLEQIELLDRDHAPPGRLLGELRELVREAEAWARVEGDGRARTAVGKLREEAGGMS